MSGERRVMMPGNRETGMNRHPCRPPAVAALSLAMLLAAFMVTSGCNVTYDPPSLINKLRVVAVRAEPPVLGSATTTLTPLILGVPAGAELCHAWSLCLFALNKDGRYECVDAELETSLGQGLTATVTLQQAFGLLGRMKPVFEKLDIHIPKEFGGGGTPSLADAGGFEIFIRFKVAERDGPDGSAGSCPADGLAWLAEPCRDRDRCIAGYKRLALATNPGLHHNNPVLTTVEVDGVAWPADVTPTVPCYQGDDSFAQVGVGALAMEPRWTPESREEIPVKKGNEGVDPKREGLLFSWLSTAGDWKKQRTFDDVPDNHFLPPDYGDDEVQRVRVWVVARDGRNGTTWLSRQVDVRRGAPTTGNPLCRARPSLSGCAEK